MTEPLSNVVLDEEQTLIDDLPDAALELAGRKLCDGPAGSATLSFCSGYDTCPWDR
jgi:hypothetical protein